MTLRDEVEIKFDMETRRFALVGWWGIGDRGKQTWNDRSVLFLILFYLFLEEQLMNL